ncbi:MAG: protein-glutamate O-methyltransferase CheR [Desulfobulbaceae bacterium]|nr:protein-glutamate O-methyltransferase CheR [Desulfobulbaceae bacterium]
MTTNHNQSESLTPLLAFLGSQRLIDFGAYLPSMLQRRIWLRLRRLALTNLGAYQAYLVEHPEEISRLFDSLSITVSHFFRNPLTFALLRERIVPALIARAGGEGVRIWCAGCGQGEEAYSLAILIHDYCRNEGISVPVVILASDIDREALARAQRGWYRPEVMEEVTKGYLDRYFRPDGEGYQLVAPIRSLVTFVHHDLTSATPPPEGIFSDYQLILCRNVLIYFNRERGGLVQQQLAGQLRAGGWLVLGEAEGVDAALGGTLREVLPESHIFRKEG